MKIPKLNSKRSKIAQKTPDLAPEQVIEAVASTEGEAPKKSAYQKEADKITGTLTDLRDDKKNVDGMFSRIYHIPSETSSKVAQKTGQVPKSVNVYGSHYPVVRLMNDGKTLLLHTSDYGEDGKTTELVGKIKSELPSVFPESKIIEIHHPDYRHSAKVMRIKSEDNVHKYLENASQNHPDENYRTHTTDALNHLRGLKKGEYSKPIHAKRTEGEGWDYKKNLAGRIDRLHQYLSKVGLTLSMDSDSGRKLGADVPTSVSINHGGDPHDQQILHEASHAMLTPPEMSVGEYQHFIGKPGFDAKMKASASREKMQEMHGGGMSEQTAQQMEAGIARRSGIEPFRSPRRGVNPDSAEERARGHAKQTLDRFDQGVYSFDPFTGENELGSGIDAVINSKTMGDKALTDKIRQKFKEHIGGHKDLEDNLEHLAASEKNVIRKSIVDEMFGVLSKSDKKLPKVKQLNKKLNTIEKFEIPKPIKAAVLTTALASAGHQMVSDSKIKPETRQVASQERVVSPEDRSYQQAYNEGMKISYVNRFQGNPSKTVIKETIKKHPDLSEAHGYMLKLGPNAFKEVIQHNKSLVKEVAARHYDHVSSMFDGNQEKIDRALDSNIKGAKEPITE